MSLPGFCYHWQQNQCWKATAKSRIHTIQNCLCQAFLQGENNIQQLSACVHYICTHFGSIRKKKKRNCWEEISYPFKSKRGKEREVEKCWNSVNSLGKARNTRLRSPHCMSYRNREKVLRGRVAPHFETLMKSWSGAGQMWMGMFQKFLEHTKSTIAIGPAFWTVLWLTSLAHFLHLAYASSPPTWETAQSKCVSFPLCSGLLWCGRTSGPICPVNVSFQTPHCPPTGHWSWLGSPP